MSTTSGSRDYGRFDELAEEFAERYRRGERPSLQEYVDRLPAMAAEIREMFPALVEVERAEGDVHAEARQPSPAAIKRLREIGDYRILREVGRGGMGVVYEAEQISLGRRVALKVLPAHAVGDRTAMERFRREAKAAARMHHTNIVPVFEVGREGEFAFYAMQLIQGQGLDQVIDELKRLHGPDRRPANPGGTAPVPLAETIGAQATGRTGPDRDRGRIAELLLSGRMVTEGPGAAPIAAPAMVGLDPTEALAPDAPWDRANARHPPGPSGADPSNSAVLPGGTHVSEYDTTGHRQPFFRSVAQIGRQAAQGLAHAHSRGIVHRDIKPSNLLLDTAGVVWITDFGLAKSDDDGLTATGDILGTLRYMAPERFRGQGDARADLYALGMTLYELLTLRPAYDSLDRLRLIEQIQGQEPPRPRSIDARIPRDLETIVLKAMDRAPEGRYATADAMAEDLRRFLADEPIQARQAGTTERYWRWARRNPVVATLGGILTAILVMVTVGSTLMAARFADLAEREGNSATAERAARLDSDRLAEAESRARFEAEAARQAESEAKRGAVTALADAIDQTYVATRNEVRAMRLAHEPGWRSGALERLRGLTRLGSRNLDREALRSDAIACLAEIDLKVESNFRPGNLGAWRVQFSPDGQVLAVSDTHKSQIYLRNLANRQVLPAVPKPLGGSPFAFHPGGALTQPSERGRVVSLALAPGQPTFPPIEGQGHAVNLAFSRSGERLAIAWGQVDERLAGIPVNLERVTVHATTTGALLRTITLPVGIEVHWKVALALSPDGRSVAVTGTGRDVRIYPVESEAPPAILGTLDAPIAAVAFHPDGQSLAACGKRFAIIWDLESRSERTRLHAADRGFWDLAFSPDGRYLATTSDDAMGRLWDSRSGRELAAAPAGVGAGLSVAFSPRGDRFAIGGGSASVLTIEGGHERLTDTTQTYNTNSLVFDPVEPRIFYSGENGTIHAWRPGANEVRIIQPPWVDLNLSALKLGPGGRDFVLGYGRNMRTGPGADYSLRVRSRDDIMGARSLKGPQTSVNWVDLDPAGLHVAASSVDNKLHVWEFRTGTLRFQKSMADTVRALRFLDDARLLVATTNRLLMLSIHDGAVLRELEIAGEVGALVLTPDGAEAIVGTTEGALHRVQLASLTITQSRIAHDAGGRLKLAISSDGSLLAVPTQGHRLVALLDARTLEPRAHLPGLEAGSVAFLEFDPKGRYLAFGDAHVRLWDLGLIEGELATVELAMGLPTTRLPSSVGSVAVPGSLDPADLERSTGLLRAGVIAVQEGRFADGVVILQEASDRLESLRRAGPEGAMVARRQGECDGFLAGALRELGRRGEALASSRRSLAAYASLSDPDPRDLYNTACGLAMISGLDDRAGPSDRERLQVQSVAALRRAIAADGPRIAALLAGDHDLDPLRARSDFQGLVADTTFPRYPFAHTFPVDVVGSLAPGERAELSELSEQVERHLESSWAWRARGDFFARRGAWAPARADFRRALELNPPAGWREADFDNIFALDSAVVLIESGDHEGHRRLAQAMLDRFAGSKDPAVADTTAKVNLLTAPPAEDLGRALRFAQRAVDEGEGSGIFSWCLLARGMAAYRTGEFAVTLGWLEKAGRSNLGPDHASACKSYSAMAEHRLGHTERAEVLLGEAGKLVADRAAQKDVGAGWHNLRIAAMAHREAQALIHPAPSPVNGPAQP